ncbi:MAG: nuclear transport factor 2 family protein [Mycobacterium sp.]
MTDREEILDLIHRYAELVDAGDFDAVGELLGRAAFGGPRTPRVTGARNIAAVFAMTTRRFDDGTPKTRHLVLNPIVEVDGDTAAARSTFCVVQATGRLPLQPVVVGRYYDDFARDPGGWHFTQRIADVEMTGNVSDHLLIDPAAMDR